MADCVAKRFCASERARLIQINFMYLAAELASSPVCGPSNTVLSCVFYRIECGRPHGGKTHRKNIATERVEDAKAFYADILGLNLVMDLGWILTFAGREAAAP
jgi:hypothetical protein